VRKDRKPRPSRCWEFLTKLEFLALSNQGGAVNELRKGVVQTRDSHWKMDEVIPRHREYMYTPRDEISNRISCWIACM
jgi:hypothetical protein